MATFFTELWNSVFTPGPTPTLLVATNASFALLQIVLLALLAATYSIHFLILSFISVGLWWAINWFVVELKAVQAVEEAKKKEQIDRREGNESDTEAETIIDPGGAGSKEVEVQEPVGELRMRGSQSENRSDLSTEVSTEDEWEKVSENEKDK